MLEAASGPSLDAENVGATPSQAARKGLGTRTKGAPRASSRCRRPPLSSPPRLCMPVAGLGDVTNTPVGKSFNAGKAGGVKTLPRTKLGLLNPNGARCRGPAAASAAKAVRDDSLPPVEHAHPCGPSSPTCFDRSGLKHVQIAEAAGAMRAPAFRAPSDAELAVPPSPMLVPPSPMMLLPTPGCHALPRLSTRTPAGDGFELDLDLSTLSFADLCEARCRHRPAAPSPRASDPLTARVHRRPTSPTTSPTMRSARELVVFQTAPSGALRGAMHIPHGLHTDGAPGCRRN
jgi:hypothetical protein